MIGRGDGGYNGGVLTLTAEMVEHGARPNWLGYLHVADGSPFYVMASIPPPGKPESKSDVFDVSIAQHVRWNELASADRPRAKQFYAKHVGCLLMRSLHNSSTLYGEECRCDGSPRTAFLEGLRLTMRYNEPTIRRH